MTSENNERVHCALDDHLVSPIRHVGRLGVCIM